MATAFSFLKLLTLTVLSIPAPIRPGVPSPPTPAASWAGAAHLSSLEDPSCPLAAGAPPPAESGSRFAAACPDRW